MFDLPEMTLFQWLLCGWALCACLLWCMAAGRIFRGSLALRFLQDQKPEEPAAWPKLSILIAACNEADTLKDAMNTMLAQDYRALEIVVVNDRSTDGTDKVVDELAASDSRIVPVHIETLPPGWLGKVHALDAARKKATGQWLLFTDADVHFEPGAIKTAVAHSLSRQLDHLAVIPSVRADGFWLRVAMSAGVLPTLLKLPIQRVGSDDGRTVMGTGAFNLVRAGKLDETQGLAWMRMEIADDYALAYLLRQAGARAAVLGGAGQVWLRWYPSLKAMLRRMDKSFYAVRYSYLRLMVAVVLAGWFIAGPLVGLLATPVPLLRLLAVLAYVLLAGAGVISARKLDWPAWPCLLLPVGLAIVTFGFLRGGINCWRRGGLIWRETLYPVQQLRASHKIRL